jgi:hypothetical protein
MPEPILRPPFKKTIILVREAIGSRSVTYSDKYGEFVRYYIPTHQFDGLKPPLEIIMTLEEKTG